MATSSTNSAARSGSSSTAVAQRPSGASGRRSDSTILPPSGSRVGVSNSRLPLSDWRHYANADGAVTTPPNYPDVSYGAYLQDGGNLLGIGYNSWKDQRLAAYNTAYNMYQQWYDSTAQQVARIGAAGLNTNLAYGMATPGTSPGSARAESSGPNPSDVFFGGVNAIVGLASGTKALAEAATIVNELPESKLKGRIAKQIDVAAKAGAINAENSYLGSLYGARNALGLGRSKAEQESADAAYNKAHSNVSKDLLEYMTSHDAEGNETDFEGSLYAKSASAERSQKIVEYKAKKAEWNNLLSKPQYYEAKLRKMVADGDISYAQAWQANKILHNPNMDDQAKFMALQPGLPGFFAKLSFSITDKLIEGFNNTKETVRGWYNSLTQ